MKSSGGDHYCLFDGMLMIEYQIQPRRCIRRNRSKISLSILTEALVYSSISDLLMTLAILVILAILRIFRILS
jgi:hypothetical protein